jgi:predicted nucleic acid-binding protein
VVLYCDTSALVKLIVDEPQSNDLDAWLAQAGEPVLASSIIAHTEVIRAVRRHGTAAVEEAVRLLDEISIIDLDEDLARSAADLEPESLRSLNALHVATAQRVGPILRGLVTYDRRMIEAARAAGLTVHHPGR